MPVCFEGAYAPQLEDVAALVGVAGSEAIDALCAAPLRVLTLGFAPGQPYLGLLPNAWDIPRQAGLTPKVSPGAVVVAARQLVIFAVPAQTGWRQVGQAAFRPFLPQAASPVALSPGMRLQLVPVGAKEFAELDPEAPLKEIRG